MGTELLHYRAWRGPLRPPSASVWPIARVSLRMMFRRRLFWALYGLGLLMFFFFFFGQYLFAWASAQLDPEAARRFLGPNGRPEDLIHFLRDVLKLNGSGETFANYFWYQGHMTVVILALAGSLVVGNDIHFGSLPFYLAKPVSRVHYVLGKCLAVAVFVNLMTTLPAIVLFVQYGLLDTWDYYLDSFHLLLGIVGYGVVLTVTLSLLLVATATWVRRTVPMVMVWTGLFAFCQSLARALVNELHYDARWRLIDLWNNAFLVGQWMLGVSPRGSQPETYLAGLVLTTVCTVCVIYLVLRIRAVEIVR
jgi:ABC-type transport system involved in multi-copper enzyme maturation permease subunit